MASKISSLISSAEGGDRSAALFAVLNTELHRLAERHLARGGRTTTLLHEACLHISRREGPALPDRVSEHTVQRHWDKARIYLHRVLRWQSDSSR